MSPPFQQGAGKVISATRAAFVLVGLCTLLLGGVLGYAGGHLQRRGPRGPWGPGERGPRGGHEDMARWLDGELDLDEAQEAAVRATMERGAERLRTVFEEFRPRMEVLRRDLEAEVRSRLTPAQAERYDALLVEGRQRREAWRRGGPGHGEGDRVPPGKE